MSTMTMVVTQSPIHSVSRNGWADRAWIWPVTSVYCVRLHYLALQHAFMA